MLSQRYFFVSASINAVKSNIDINKCMINIPY